MSMHLPRHENPEIQILAEPNVEPAGHITADAVVVLLLGGLGYVLWRAVHGGQLTAGVVDGDFLQEQYPTSPVAACDHVQAILTVVNPTASSRSYVIEGDVVNAAGQVVGHWWPDAAQGASSATAYHGLPVTLPAFHTARVTATTSPWSLPGTFGAHWTLTLNGTVLTTRVRSAAFTTSFTTTSTHCGAPA